MSKSPFDVREKLNEIPIMHQDWRNMLFLHWKYSPEEIQKTLPHGLYVDTFENNAYLTILPFTIENQKIANFLKIPGLSSFIEVNFRTYVVDENGIPGVWFYSLDLNSYLGVKAARITYALPYFFADLTQQMTKEKGIFLKGNRDSKINMQFSYKPLNSEGVFAKQGSLDFFLIERYVLFSYRSNQLNLARVHHKPYLIKQVEELKFSQDLDKPFGFCLSDIPDHTHYSPGVDVDIFALRKDVHL